MNRNSYEDLYDDGPENRQKPHAQIHLLSPTDKCKVKVLQLIINDDKIKVDR